jgi:SAM-dependent methyltransferase
VTDEKFILDATAGFRMMWFNKHHPNTIYLDQRPECEPDIVGDFRDLKQFKDETFRLIVFDPPHIITSNENLNSNMRRDFGVLRPDTWKGDLVKAFAGLWRVLAPYGILIFKWCSQYRPSSEILDAIPQKPLFYQIQANMDRIVKNKKLSHVQTSWFCFMKIPEEKVEA